MEHYSEILQRCSMIMKWQDTLENWKHTMLSDNTIGGWVYRPLLKTTYRDVAYANNSKLTDTLQNWHFYLPKGQSQLDHSQTVPWILSDLPPVDGFDSILVVVDQGLSKGVILMPCNKTITLEGTA